MNVICLDVYLSNTHHAIIAINHTCSSKIHVYVCVCVRECMHAFDLLNEVIDRVVQYKNMPLEIHIKANSIKGKRTRSYIARYPFLRNVQSIIQFTQWHTYSFQHQLNLSGKHYVTSQSPPLQPLCSQVHIYTAE